MEEINRWRPLCSAVVKLRESKGLTQEQLGQRTGVAQGTIGRFECCQKVPSMKLLKKILEGLGADLKIEFDNYKIIIT